MEYQVAADENTAAAIIESVSRFENCPVESLPPLQETVDVEGLNKLCEGGAKANLSISFNFSNTHVCIKNQTIYVSSINTE